MKLLAETTYWRLLTIDYYLVIANWRLLTLSGDYLLETTYWSLFTGDYLLETTYLRTVCVHDGSEAPKNGPKHNVIHRITKTYSC